MFCSNMLEMVPRQTVVYMCVILPMLTYGNEDTAPPKVNVYSNGQVVQSSIQINCYVQSNSTPTVQWLGEFHCSSKCPPTEGYSHGYFWSNRSAHYAKTDDVYTCIANNSFGQSNASYTVPCLKDGDTCLQWDNKTRQSITIIAGQSHSISCKLLINTDNKRIIDQCYQFGITKGNRSYPTQPTITKSLNIVGSHIYWISYGYNITNANRDDSGMYSCYYSKTSRCGDPKSKDFIVNVVDPESKEGERKTRKIEIAVSVSIGSALVGLIIVMFVCLRRRRLKLQRLNESEPELRWDVFVSYCSKDFDWVSELCKTLEQAPFNLTVCLHQRDWEAGRTILDNMAESVYCSVTTLLVVSKDYMESPFCMQELNIAMECEHSSAKKLLRERVILIKLDDVSLKNLPKSLKQKSYLDFSDEEQRKHYKAKLLKALPKRKLDELSDESGNGNFCQESEGDTLVEEVGNENVETVPLAVVPLK